MTRLMLFIIAVLSASIAQAQQVPTTNVVAAPATLPSELSGRWYTPDHQYSKEWKITKINQAAGSALVTWYSTNRSCFVLVDVPAKVEFDGSTLRISFADEKYRLCTEKFVAELKWNGSEFEGKVWPGNSNNPKYSYAETKLK